MNGTLSGGIPGIKEFNLAQVNNKKGHLSCSYNSTWARQYVLLYPLQNFTILACCIVYLDDAGFV